MCCCCPPRCSLIFVGAWCLVQSIVWLILGAIAISVYTCVLPFELDTNHPWHVIYFHNRDCFQGPTTPGNYSTTTIPFPPSGWPDSDADYTRTLVSLYAGLNAAWAVTCIIAIVAAAKNVRSWFAYLPWILLAIANIVLDVIATVQFANDVADSEENWGGFNTLESSIMLGLACRLGILWLLNVLFLICVPFSVHRLGNKKGKNQHLATYPHTGPVNRGLENRPYIKERHTEETGQEFDYTDGRIHNGPYTGGNLSRSSTAPGTNLHSPPTQSNNLKLLQPQHRHQEPSAPAENYGWRMPVTNDLKGNNRADRPAGGIALPRVDVEYVKSRQGTHNSLASADNYKPQPSRRQSATHDVGADDGPYVQRMAPHLNRADSDSSPKRPPVPPKNLQRPSASSDEVDRPQDQNSKVNRRASQTPEELLSQLPWSYFGPRKTQIKPKPIQESVDEEELEKPPVPVPDYTLHFGKTDRPTQPKWSEDGTSFPDSRVNHRNSSVSSVDRSSSFLENSRY